MSAHNLPWFLNANQSANMEGVRAVRSVHPRLRRGPRGRVTVRHRRMRSRLWR